MISSALRFLALNVPAMADLPILADFSIIGCTILLLALMNLKIYYKPPYELEKYKRGWGAGVVVTGASCNRGLFFATIQAVLTSFLCE